MQEIKDQSEFSMQIGVRLKTNQNLICKCRTLHQCHSGEWRLLTQPLLAGLSYTSINFCIMYNVKNDEILRVRDFEQTLIKIFKEY